LACFYLFVRYYESGGRAVFVARPPGIEGWLPIAALMNLKYVALTGTIPTIHQAGLFLLVAFLAISMRRGYRELIPRAAEFGHPADKSRPFGICSARVGYFSRSGRPRENATLGGGRDAERR
jgi:hypothetical protein